MPLSNCDSALSPSTPPDEVDWLRSASKRTRRAVTIMLWGLPDAEDIKVMVARAWARPPSTNLRSAVLRWLGTRERQRSVDEHAKCGGPQPGPAVFRSVYFRLDQTGTGDDACAHQVRIERPETCVTSFGTIADTQLERLRLWREIAARCRISSGRIEIACEGDAALAAVVAQRVPVWVDAGMLSASAERSVEVRDREATQGSGAQIADSYNGAVLRPADQREHPASGEHSVARRLRRPGREVPKDTIVLSTPGPERHEAVLAEVETFMPFGLRRQRIREFKPRSPIIQRRILLELAHELSDEARETALRRWCKANLSEHGLNFHACIHAPSHDGDARNFHAQVVYPQFILEREPDTVTWTFERERTLPAVTYAMRVLSGNAEGGRPQRDTFIRTWRERWVKELNRELERCGATKRYVVRSEPSATADRETMRSEVQWRGLTYEEQWQQLAAWLADALGAPASRRDGRCEVERLPEAVRDGFERLRLGAGMEDHDEHAPVCCADYLYGARRDGSGTESQSCGARDERVAVEPTLVRQSDDESSRAERVWNPGALRSGVSSITTCWRFEPQP